jgi:hypothetical protein
VGRPKFDIGLDSIVRNEYFVKCSLFTNGAGTESGAVAKIVIDRRAKSRAKNSETMNELPGRGRRYSLLWNSVASWADGVDSLYLRNEILTF